MMGPRQEAQPALFYQFSLEDHIPQNHLLRSIDRFVDLSGIRTYLADFYSHTGRPSVDPELLIRMLLVGYCFGIRSERRLCEEVHLNLAYRWFCRLDLSDRVPDHSTFSKNRHGRFRDSELLRHLFETTVARCIEEGLVSGQRMAIDASLIEADANKQNSTPKEEWDTGAIDPADALRAVREYLDTLDEAAFGAASEVQPKFTSHSDPASQWTAARKGPAFFSYSDNYLIDTDHGVIVDVEATRSIRQAEVGSTKTMLKRVKARFDLHPERLIADTAYGTAPMLGWLVDRKIAPHIPVLDNSGRNDGTWTRADFEWDAENDQYICRRVPTVPSSKPRRNAAVNRGTTVFATHDLGSAPCGCPVGQVGAIVRFKRITSVMGPARLSRALSPASLAYFRGVPKCIRCAMTLTWNDFLKAVTKLDKMNPTLSILVLARIFTRPRGCRM